MVTFELLLEEDLEGETEGALAEGLVTPAQAWGLAQWLREVLLVGSAGPVELPMLQSSSNDHCRNCSVNLHFRSCSFAVDPFSLPPARLPPLPHRAYVKLHASRHCAF
jgi:hypothetical protein